MAHQGICPVGGHGLEARSQGILEALLTSLGCAPQALVSNGRGLNKGILGSNLCLIKSLTILHPLVVEKVLQIIKCRSAADLF